MKHLLIISITIYQKLLSPSIRSFLGVNSACRFYPTCSEYSKQVVSEKGALTGSILTIWRILKCQPFYSPAI